MNDINPANSAFKISAHRGATTEAPENTLESFRRAFDMGADGVELDVRLTRDQRAVVYHYFYLDEFTTATGPIFKRTAKDLENVRATGTGAFGDGHFIPTLEAVLDEFGGRLGLEIEVKGPEPEAATIVGGLLAGSRHIWDSVEVTSFEPALLLEIKRQCPGIRTALLFPRSEDWMGLDVVAYAAAQRARLARASAVHLHPSQLTQAVVSTVHAEGIEVHAWDVNDEPAFQLSADLKLPWICTDRLEAAVRFRDRRRN